MDLVRELHTAMDSVREVNTVTGSVRADSTPWVMKSRDKGDSRALPNIYTVFQRISLVRPQAEMALGYFLIHHDEDHQLHKALRNGSPLEYTWRNEIYTKRSEWNVM